MLPPRINKRGDKEDRKTIPEGLWVKCAACETVLYNADLEANLHVCLSNCDHHMRISARDRLEALLDEEGRYQLGDEVQPVDTLKFKDSKKYPDPLESGDGVNQRNRCADRDGRNHPVIAGGGGLFRVQLHGRLDGFRGRRAFCSRRAGGALEKKAPFICFSASGGARMQEGLLSLFQMTKTSAILTKLAEEKLPFISVLTDPTMGGVSASFAFLGDVVMAEPKALVGFAGQRVIENTVREKLPEGFQRAEFLLEKGAIDMIVDRRKMRSEIAHLLALLQNQPIEAVA